jgi:ABC-2 type transport system permease protein
MTAAVAILAARLRMGWNRAFRSDPETRRLRNALAFLALLTALLIFGASYRAFHHLLHNLTAAPELGAPLTLRLIEMAHLLFFVMLTISTLSTTLSVFFLDPELDALRNAPISRPLFIADRIATTFVRASWFVLFAAAPLLLGYTMAAHPLRAVPARLFLAFAIHLVSLLPPALLGISAAIVIARWIPARRVRTALVLLTVVGLSLVIFGLRAMTPERFLRPRIDPNLAITLSAVAEPASPWLPSGWAAEAIVMADPVAAAKILLLAAGALFAAWVVIERMHAGGLDRLAREGKAPARRGGWLFATVLGLLPQRARLVAAKDLRLFWRDPSQWTQLIILLALVVIYVFNFRQIKGEIGSYFLRDILSLVNLGMAGFVLVAVANRFVFSAISLEGKAIWLMKTSPYPASRLLVAKAWVSFWPLLILTETVTWLSNRALEVSAGYAATSALVVLLMTLGITSLGVGLGALAPRFDLRDPARIGMTPNGILFMGIGLLYVGLTVATLAARIVMNLQRFRIIDAPWLVMGPPLLLIALNLVVVFVPWRLGLARIEQMELK